MIILLLLKTVIIKYSMTSLKITVTQLSDAKNVQIRTSFILILRNVLKIKLFYYLLNLFLEILQINSILMTL